MKFANSRLLSFSIICNTSNNLSLLSLNTNNLILNNIKFKSFIHSSSIIKSDRNNPTYSEPSRIRDTSNPDNSTIDQLEIARQERESKLQVEKYTKNSQEDVSSREDSNSDITVDIPLELRNEFGLVIDCTHPISMFDGVKIISRYLELQHNIDPAIISETKLTEILEIFQKAKGSNGLVTAEDLFQHMNEMFEKNKEIYHEILKTESKNLSENLISESQASKPFGEHGEITLNQIGLNLKENLKHLNEVR